jgi:hypothetical protein
MEVVRVRKTNDTVRQAADKTSDYDAWPDRREEYPDIRFPARHGYDPAFFDIQYHGSEL